MGAEISLEELAPSTKITIHSQCKFSMTCCCCKVPIISNCPLREERTTIGRGLEIEREIGRIYSSMPSSDLFIFTVGGQAEVDFVKENLPSKTISEILTKKIDNTYSIGCCSMIWILFHCLELNNKFRP